MRRQACLNALRRFLAELKVEYPDGKFPLPSRIAWSYGVELISTDGIEGRPANYYETSYRRIHVQGTVIGHRLSLKTEFVIGHELAHHFAMLYTGMAFPDKDPSYRGYWYFENYAEALGVILTGEDHWADQFSLDGEKFGRSKTLRLLALAKYNLLRPPRA